MYSRSLKIGVAVSVLLGVLLAPGTASGDPGIGSAFPFPGVIPNSVYEPPAGSPAFPAAAPPPVLALASLISPPNAPGFGNIDDISYADEMPLTPPLFLEFSVGPGAFGPSTGHPGAPPPPAPLVDVLMEATVGDLTVNSDIYTSFPFPLPPPPPCGPIGTNAQILDGSGGAEPPFFAPKLGLSMPEPGSNVDGYDRSDEIVVDFIPLAGDGVPDAPVFFSIDAATAGAWPPAFMIPTVGGGVAVPTPDDILAWNPAIGAPVIYATGGALGLVPGDDVDALAMFIPPGTALPPTPGAGFDVAPVGPIVFSLAPGSPSLSPTSGGLAATGLTPSCSPAGTGTAADLWFVGGPVLPGGATAYIHAEGLGLNTVRSGGGGDDNIDAIDTCNSFMATDYDGDFIDQGCDYDKDGDGIGNFVDPDDDGDSFGDPQSTTHQGPANTVVGTDNCPMDPNPAQTNSDGNFIDMTGPKLFDDLSWANSDMFGDDCDPDDDNDGISDVGEMTGGSCGGIVTSPTVRDTDGDHALDFAECSIGTDPTLIGSEPSFAACTAASAAGDGDGDVVLSSREFCYYNSTYTVVNTDGDTRNDGCEVYSINADQTVNVIDLQQVASESGAYVSPGTVVQVNYDVTKDGNINVIDLQQVAAGDAVCP